MKQYNQAKDVKVGEIYWAKASFEGNQTAFILVEVTAKLKNNKYEIVPVSGDNTCIVLNEKELYEREIWE